MDRKIYIAYGSNLNLPQMAIRCPGAAVIGKSALKDYELVFRGGRRGAVATVEPKKGVPCLYSYGTSAKEMKGNLTIMKDIPGSMRSRSWMWSWTEGLFPQWPIL